MLTVGETAGALSLVKGGGAAALSLTTALDRIVISQSTSS